jgi:hypothetical protein
MICAWAFSSISIDQGKTTEKNNKKRLTGKGFKPNGAYAGITDPSTVCVHLELNFLGHP